MKNAKNCRLFSKKMVKMYTDWKILSLLSILSWGLWGFLSKVVVNKLECGTILALLAVGTLIVVLITTPASFALKINQQTGLGLLAGILCGFGYFFFYRALHHGEASTVIPITSLYIVIAAILAVIFLREPVTIRKVSGIIAAVVAILLLSK